MIIEPTTDNSFSALVGSQEMLSRSTLQESRTAKVNKSKSKKRVATSAKKKQPTVKSARLNNQKTGGAFSKMSKLLNPLGPKTKTVKR